MEPWPALPLENWLDTYQTLHMWMQVVGKIRLAQTPLLNHWWNVPFYITARGLTTSPIPHDGRTFQIDFDFNAHRLWIRTSAGKDRTLVLKSMSVSDFYHQVMVALRSVDV